MIEKLPHMEDEVSPPKDDSAHKAFPVDLVENGATTPLKPVESDGVPLPSFGTYYPDEPHEYTPLER